MLRRICAGVRECYRWLTLIVVRGRATPEELYQAASEVGAPPSAAEPLRALSEALMRRGLGDAVVGIEASVIVDRDTAVRWARSIAS